ncbi:hypothetical protein JHK84_026862 [Glycine max]|nr:hypothetical protein JHK85_027247 [Glycine max]KAG5002611.1 hypothetical protein JHK86_026750 [Glycine max]KAG5150390.1 hypothetical protein JHK84_026862 [Glycine max]
MKYVVISGGVVSGLGKGVTASSIGVVLKACGLRVTSIKIDPYLNIDAGTMSPFEHGEVFVLDDGGEVDLDLGNYERFLDVTLTKDNNITTGKIYQSVLEKERKGDYLGKTVQLHYPLRSIMRERTCLSTGDIESMPFIEALRQLSFQVGPDNFCLIHVSLIPVLGVVGEQKTKPTQHSVRELRALGLTPHLLTSRSAEPLLESTKEKLSKFCHVPVENILNIHDVPNIWHIPLLLRNQNAHHSILQQLNLLSQATPPDLQQWTEMAETYDNLTESVRIAMVGKYVGLTDSYLSVVKALLHACVARSFKPSIDWIAASDLEDDSEKSTPEAHAAAWKTLKSADCVLVPGGFGDRGVRGMMLAAKYARENSVPYLGICLGMQISVIEFARSVLGWERANSVEFDAQTPNPVVIFMPEGSRTHMGSTMRLGSRRTLLQTSDCITSKLFRLSAYIKSQALGVRACWDGLMSMKIRTGSEFSEYGSEIMNCVVENFNTLLICALTFCMFLIARYGNSEYVDERHRHRYEVNPDVIETLEEAGLKFVGKDESGKRMEILELPSHPFYVGAQFHPEFKSRPARPSALFLGLILAATGKLEAYISSRQNGS